MIQAMGLLLVVAGVLLVFRIIAKREDCISLSAMIDRPPECVFEVVGSVGRTPLWRGQPCWLPRPFRILALACWGDRSSDRTRGGGCCHQTTDAGELRVRSVPDREFSCRRIRKDLSYESVFRISPGNGRCLLVWELRYQLRRVPDILSRRMIAADARRSMERSLDHIRRFALSLEVSGRHEQRFESRGSQISAA